MKTAHRAVWISSLLLIVIGISLIGTSIALGGCRWERTDSQAETLVQAFHAIDVTALTVRDRNRAIRVVPSPDDQLRVRYTNSSRGQYSVGMATDGEVDVIFEPVDNPLRLLLGFLEFRNQELVLEIPANLRGKVDLETTNGLIEIEKQSILNDVSVQSTNAVVRVNDSTFAGSLTVKTTNGLLSAENVEVAKTSEWQTTNGRIAADRLNVADRLSLRTTNGPIRVDLIQSPDISLRTTNGPVNGTIDGLSSDYTIRSQTSNGRNNTPERTGGTKQLRIETSNGRVDVMFSQDHLD